MRLDLSSLAIGVAMAERTDALPAVRLADFAPPGTLGASIHVGKPHPCAA